MSDDQPAVTKNTMNAVDVLKQVHRIADNLSRQAELMISDIAKSPRPAVEIGSFYRTIDGSLVFVLRAANKCQCPTCTGRGAGGTFVAIPLLMPPGFSLQTMEAQPAPDPEPEAHQGDDGPRSYVVMILSGGHGIKEAQGEEPGESYLVDEQGLTVMKKPDPSRNSEVISTSQIGVAGLSLSRRLNVRVEPAAIEEAVASQS